MMTEPPTDPAATPGPPAPAPAPAQPVPAGVHGQRGHQDEGGPRHRVHAGLKRMS